MGRARGLGVCLALALLLAPGALAGTETDPEIDDHPDRGDGTLDLLAAWLENDPRGVRFTIKVAAAEAPPADRYYYLAFTVDGRRHLAGLGFAHGVLHGHAGGTDAGRDGSGVESFGDNLLGPEFRPGAPATFTAIIPWGAVDGLEPGATLVDLTAGTSLYRRGVRTWEGAIDTRSSDRVFVAEKPLLSPDARGTLLALAPWLVAAPMLVAAGVYGARLWHARTERAQAQEGPTRSLQPSAPEPPERPRLRLRPPS